MFLGYRKKFTQPARLCETWRHLLPLHRPLSPFSVLRTEHLYTPFLLLLHFISTSLYLVNFTHPSDNGTLQAFQL